MANLVYESKKNNKNDLFSIIIPTFNRFETLKEAILSIKQLPSFNCDILIVDNSPISNANETISFLKTLNQYSVKYYVNETNLGMVGNWNEGLKLCDTKFIAYLHDDDLLDPSYFLVVSDFFNRYNSCLDSIGFLKAKFDFFHKIDQINYTYNLKYSYREVKKFESLLNGVGPTGPPTCGIVFNRKALTNIGGFDENLYPCADHIVGFQLLDKGYNGYETFDIVGHYRWGENETLKKKTIVMTVAKNQDIRRLIYKNNLLYSIFGKIFERVQSTIEIHSYSLIAKKNSIEISLNELDLDNLYINSKILFQLENFCFKFVRKVMKLLFCSLDYH